MDINISNYLRLDVVDMIMVLVSTLILCLFAKHFFWDYVSDYFQKRHDAIAADLKAGADAKAEGENYRQQYEQQLAGAKGEARETGYGTRKGTGSAGNETNDCRCGF